MQAPFEKKKLTIDGPVIWLILISENLCHQWLEPVFFLRRFQNYFRLYVSIVRPSHFIREVSIRG